VSVYFPVFVDLEGQPCVVIGGGPVAERKVAGLLAVRARVTVIAPRTTAAIDAWTRQGAIAHVARAYRAGDLAGHRLAFVATDDPDVTDAVADEARECNVWVNAADDPARCDFILPSVLRRGQLTVAVGTGGASPALARLVREELEGWLGDDYAALVEVAADVRGELARRLTASSQLATDVGSCAKVAMPKRERAC
jgi:precorrin-2 dehydrogenase/sirohydrochlorin ferrochelatase